MDHSVGILYIQQSSRHQHASSDTYRGSVVPSTFDALSIPGVFNPSSSHDCPKVGITVNRQIPEMVLAQAPHNC